MRFSDALEQSPMPSRVGDVRLRYEPALLIGEARRRPGLLPAVAFATGVGCGLGSVAALFLPTSAGPTLSLAVTLGASSALLLGLSVVLEDRQKAVRRFVLNFATESLRLERPSGARARPSLQVVHFDGVRELEVVCRPDGRFALQVQYAPGPGPDGIRVEVLVDRVHPAEVETLRRLWRLLRGSFGLRTPWTPPTS